MRNKCRGLLIDDVYLQSHELVRKLTATKVIALLRWRLVGGLGVRLKSSKSRAWVQAVD